MRMRLGELRALIREAMVSPSAAVGGGAALYSFEDEVHTVHVLYNSEKIYQVVTDMSSDLYTGSKLSIIGAIRIATEGQPQVSDVRASHGYGPLLYDIALSAHGSLAPSENRKQASVKVWDFYQTKRTDTSFRDGVLKPLKRMSLGALRGKHDSFEDDVIGYFENMRNSRAREEYEKVHGRSFNRKRFIDDFEEAMKKASIDYLSSLGESS